MSLSKPGLIHTSSHESGPPGTGRLAKEVLDLSNVAFAVWAEPACWAHLAAENFYAIQKQFKFQAVVLGNF